MIDNALEKFKITDKDLPQRVALDICNMCQLNCAACGLRLEEKSFANEKYGGFGYVNFETFKKFVDDNPFIKFIELSSRGEIFLNPDIEKIIKYAYEKDIQLTAYGGTNLNFLPETTAEALVKYKFSGMHVAIDGATADTYKIYRRRGDFDTVINNVKLINKYKEKYNSIYPNLVYQFVLFGHNEHEIEQAKELAKELNMGIFFAVNCMPRYSPLKNVEKVKELTGIENIDNQMEYWYEVYQKHNKNYWFICKDLFDCPRINTKGYLNGCNLLFVNDIYDINVFEVGLKNALNDERIIYAKSMLQDFSLPERSDVLCSRCHVYHWLKDNNLKI